MLLQEVFVLSFTVGYCLAFISDYQSQAIYDESPKPYDFGYDVQDELGTTLSRWEKGDGSGTVVGTYGYTDPYGVYRWVQYQADGNGFTANVKTNEPGTANQNPADVIITAEEPPAAVVQNTLAQVRAPTSNLVHSVPSYTSHPGSRLGGGRSVTAFGGGFSGAGFGGRRHAVGFGGRRSAVGIGGGRSVVGFGGGRSTVGVGGGGSAVNFVGGHPGAGSSGGRPAAGVVSLGYSGAGLGGGYSSGKFGGAYSSGTFGGGSTLAFASPGVAKVVTSGQGHGGGHHY
ncbi:glycine-rich protein 23-like [Limulus polyphemus]|uniref:Glycine-rich protein 23-like n=1 Tax=Limulus polyphemus TaxID=6850 RepID=A0ABM1BCA3_LIMPO|nr:glycine-rich protein 23-like [Limulus polyphemus]